MGIQAGQAPGFVWPFPTKDPSQYQRVDQGWDLKGPIGPVLAVAAGTVQIAGPDPGGFGNRYPVLYLDQAVSGGPAVYYGHVVPTVPAGTHVMAGAPIATTAFGPQGNATEWGWLEIGFWNNGPTGNGALMKQMLLGSSVGTATPGPTTLIFTYAQLQCLWTTAGGNAQAAPMAAAIAMAESGGNSQAVGGPNSNGTYDRGLWQINSSNGAASTLDIMGNARAAVAMSGNGTTWRPWCTAYADGACGTKGGAYLGAGAPYQKFLNPSIQPDCNFSINGTNAAAGQGVATATAFNCSDPLIWFTGAGAAYCISQQGVAKGLFNFFIGNILNTLIQDIIGINAMVAGLGLMGFGVYLTVNQTATGRAATAPVRLGARVAGTAAAPELLAATGGERTAARAQRTARINIAGRAARIQQQAGVSSQAAEKRYAERQAADIRRSREKGRPTVTTTESRTTGPPGARTTQRITVRQTLRDEAGGYRNRGQ